MADPTLYNYELDEGAYKVRLLAGLLGIGLELRGVDMFPGREHQSAAFLALAPEGRLPVLVDGDHLMSGAEACLAYLAAAYDAENRWLPREPKAFAETQRWLLFAASRLEPAVEARRQALFDVSPRNPDCVEAARLALRIMDDHMVRRGFDGGEWFAANRATIADVALFPSFALSRDFGVDHDEFPALRRWSRRVRAISGFSTMPGIPDYH